jgi:hypothetical protein
MLLFSINTYVYFLSFFLFILGRDAFAKYLWELEANSDVKFYMLFTAKFDICLQMLSWFDENIPISIACSWLQVGFFQSRLDSS